MSSKQVADIIGFLEAIGLPVRRTELVGHTFMPGVSIGGGALLVDEAKLTYPGDLLHEAGHMAVLLPEDRAACTGDAGGDAGAEIAAIAWSYAATVAMGIDPRVVFHADAYGKGGHAVADNFEQGRYMGVPLLQWFGMTLEPPRDGSAAPEAYPRMTNWLRPPGSAELL